MMHPVIRKAMGILLETSGCLFLLLSVLTVVGIVSIYFNGGRV